MKRSEERRYNNYDYPRCEGFKSPITIRDDQENKGKLASATSNQATTETHDPITSNNNEQRQPFAPRHKVNTEIQFENHEDGQESHIRVHTPRRNKHEQYGHRRSYTPRDYADSEPNIFYNENGNSTTEGYTNTDQINTSNMDMEDSILQGIMFCVVFGIENASGTVFKRQQPELRAQKKSSGLTLVPKQSYLLVRIFTVKVIEYLVDTEHPMSNLEDGYHGTPRPNKHDQYRHRRSYTSKDDVERQCSSSEGNHHDYRRARYTEQCGYRQCYVQRDAESEEQETTHCPRATDLPECYDVDTEHPMSNLEDGYHGTPRPNKHDQYRHRRSYTSKDDVERECSSSEGNHHDYRRARYQDQCGYRQCSSSEGNHHDYRRARYKDQYGYRQCYVQRDAESEEQATKHFPRTTDLPECYNVDTENLMSNLEDGYHGTPKPNKHDQYRNRRSYTSKDDESDEQATKHCPRTTDLPECYNEKRTDKCGKEKSPSTPLGKVKAQDQAPVSPISKERLIDHQDKCKLAMEEVSPAAKAINSFTNEFIKKLKEISTLNWSSFNIGSYYDKTKNCHPDEFDIMIYPNLSVEVNFDVIKIPGFYKVKLVSPRVQELEHVLDNDRYIIPGKFKNYAFEMFDRVLGTDGIRQGRRTKKMPKPGGCSPAYTVFYDAFPGKKPIDIDLVPCFNIDGWPPDKIARKINPSWIAIDDVVNRAMKYYDVVCKTCPEDATDKNLLFRLSFSRTEKMLINHANSADKLNLKKNAFRFIKLCIQDLKDKHPGEIKKFCSYHIKQFMLTQYDTWPTREREGVRIQRYLIGELIKTLSLANPTIANYFITNDNVIRYVPSEEIAVIVKGLQEKDKLLH
ncbi:cyclic GMP-AMP synthase [Mytilus galloprovincialis]|uniref:Cyclic GMP-AMP synthase n=1 Tax=Mytilus galloprovincialis TaxID=29158 RepID=A0A8B6BKU3_MYTGA|nr:cyclic GMP-AMP synthase [Mytilus galloprovincialis]